MMVPENDVLQAG